MRSILNKRASRHHPAGDRILTKKGDLDGRNASRRDENSISRRTRAHPSTIYLARSVPFGLISRLCLNILETETLTITDRTFSLKNNDLRDSTICPLECRSQFLPRIHVRMRHLHPSCRMPRPDNVRLSGQIPVLPGRLLNETDRSFPADSPSPPAFFRWRIEIVVMP